MVLICDTVMMVRFVYKLDVTIYTHFTIVKDISINTKQHFKPLK